MLVHMTVIMAMRVMMMMTMIPVSMGMAMLVPVMPEFGLVEQKEKYQPHQQHGEQIMRLHLALERFGQQVHEGGRQQRSRRQAQQMLRADAVAVAQPQAHQQCRNPYASDASRQRGSNDFQ